MATIDLEPHFLAATGAAAIAAAAWRGKGDRKAADGAAVEAMRAVFDAVPFNGRVAIGEGERDDALAFFAQQDRFGNLGTKVPRL